MKDMYNMDLTGYSFCVTGGAGFIGSHLVEYLVKNNASLIRIVDNLSTGNIENIKEFLELQNVEFISEDIRRIDTCMSACKNIDYVLHQAALGSVPRSIKDPLTTNEVNITGFLNMLTAAKENKVKRFVYAASSSTYGDSQILPKQEEIIGKPLSPYAVTKYVNELYAQVFSQVYNFHSVGLRYFNVFGPRQSPEGQYAAVIPLFIKSVLNSEPLYINGNGENSRDFTYVSNVVEANIKAIFSKNIQKHTVLNVAYGDETTLLQLVGAINDSLGTTVGPVFREVRPGDVKHSKADISKARHLICYDPQVSFQEGIKKTVAFFQSQLR